MRPPLTFTIGKIAGNTQEASIGSPVTAHCMCGCEARRYGAWLARVTGYDGKRATVRRVEDGIEYQVSPACLALVDDHHMEEKA